MIYDNQNLNLLKSTLLDSNLKRFNLFRTFSRLKFNLAIPHWNLDKVNEVNEVNVAKIYCTLIHSKYTELPLIVFSTANGKWLICITIAIIRYAAQIVNHIYFIIMIFKRPNGYNSHTFSLWECTHILNIDQVLVYINECNVHKSLIISMVHSIQAS